MHCFYHTTIDAVGVCKNCQRGLCPSCAVEITNGLACRDRCEAQVVALDQAIQRGRAAMGGGSIILASIGGLFIVVGLVTLPSGLIYLLLGILVAALGGFQIFAGRSSKPTSTKPSA